MRNPPETPVASDRKRCTKCGRIKPVGAYHVIPCRRGRLQSWCKTCVRIQVGERRETPEYREWLAAYLARPDVKARRATADRKRRERRNAQKVAYRKTPRAKLLHCRRQARIRLRAATDPARIRSIEALIAAYDREVDRIDRDLSGPKARKPSIPRPERSPHALA